VTDGRQVMHLIMMWRDETPKDWQPIAPGMDPRIVCDVPVDFGDPTITKAQSEQSVAVRGWAAMVVNNSLKDTSAFDGLAGSLRYQLATLNSGDPANAAHGVERIDWDPSTRTCSVKWINAQVSIPNAIPSLSSGSNMFYAIGARDGIWGLEGLDMTTGESRLRVETGGNPTHNSFYADIQIAPDGTVWTGTFGGVDILRPAETNAPLTPGASTGGTPAAAATNTTTQAVADRHVPSHRGRGRAAHVNWLDCTVTPATLRHATRTDWSTTSTSAFSWAGVKIAWLEAQTGVNLRDLEAPLGEVDHADRPRGLARCAPRPDRAGPP
jgi:hypothetical protein